MNNAGSSTGSSLLTGDLAAIRLEMDTHFFGTLAVIRAFTQQLAARSSSAVLTVLSVLSWLSSPRSGAYGGAKSSEWSLTNALRLELAPQGSRMACGSVKSGVAVMTETGAESSTGHHGRRHADRHPALTSALLWS